LAFSQVMCLIISGYDNCSVPPFLFFSFHIWFCNLFSTLYMNYLSSLLLSFKFFFGFTKWSSILAFIWVCIIWGRFLALSSCWSGPLLGLVNHAVKIGWPFYHKDHPKWPPGCFCWRCFLLGLS
jgi:hypothetical protein